MSVFVCLTLPVLSRTICGLRYIIITGLSLKENILHKKVRQTDIDECTSQSEFSGMLLVF